MNLKFLIFALVLIPIFGNVVYAQCTPDTVPCVDSRSTPASIHPDDAGTPRHQLEQGRTYDEILCAGDRELHFKSSNGMPVCLFSDSIQTLMKRGFI